MLDAAVDVGVDAFMAGGTAPTDETVLADLEQAGVEPWLAQRLLLFLPLAFGRRVLPGVAVSESFVDDAGEHALQDDPVFPWAVARAERATRDEVERIGLRSAEVAAVNAALNAGSELADVELASLALAEPLPPPVPGDGGVPSPRAVFEGFLAGHGFPVVQGVVQGPAGPAEVDGRVTVHPRPRTGRLMAQVDFAVRHPDLATPWLVESFAAFGATWREAIGRAVTVFERSSLHPIIATLLDHGSCADQVGRETWPHPDGAFDACLGPQLTLYRDAPAPPLGPVVDQLRDAVRTVPLTRAVHSLRIFTCHLDGVLDTVEVLLDGEPWTAGQEIVATAPSPGGQGLAGTRLFILLAPAERRPPTP